MCPRPSYAVIRMLDRGRFVGMPFCVTLPCGEIVLKVVSGMAFPSAPVSSLQMSWFVHWGDWIFSCTSARVPSVLPAVPSVFISSWSKYSSLLCQCPSSFRERVCLVSLTLLVESAAVFWCIWHRSCTSLSSLLLCHIREL